MNIWKSFCRVSLFLVGFGLTATGALPAPAKGPASLDQARFTAKGDNTTVLHTGKVGRYSLQVKSGQGTALELVDRMGGPFAFAGEAGAQDGRMDVLLDKGEYKVILHSHLKGTGEAELKAFAFQEVQPAPNPQDFPVLRPLRLESGSLGDLQQHSYWLDLRERQQLRLEIIGRNLADCWLWRDGAWLEDVRPDVSTYEPVPGQPMHYLEFHHDLNPGLYLLTCYGGPALPWAEETGKNPFYLRLGVPTLGQAGQQLLTVSPFGRDCFLVPDVTNFFQLVRAEKKNATLTVSSFNEKGSRQRSGDQAGIDKKSRDPWCIVKGSRGGDQHRQWVAVSARPGDQLELDYFVQEQEHRLPREYQDYWISSVHSVEGRDAIDVTAILSDPYQNIPVKADVVEMGPGKPVLRKVNLLEPISLFLKITEGGEYVVEENKKSGARGRYQLKPFMVSRPANYRDPEFQAAGSKFELTAGYYILTVIPESKGILHFALHEPQGWLTSMWDQLFNEGESTAVRTEKPQSARQSIIWPKVYLPPLRSTYDYYTLWLNQRGGVEAGFIVRALPLDLREPLPMILSPGQAVPITAKLEEESVVEVTGGRFELKESERILTPGATLPAGTYTFELKSLEDKMLLFTIHSGPPDTYQPPKPVVKKLEEIFATLTESKPVFKDFAREEQHQFLVKVAESALYRLETTGRMATTIKVRTPLSTSLFSESGNGIGRNALVQQYLNPGDYLITVKTNGRSSGRSCVLLRKTPLINAEPLTLDGVSRVSARPDVAVRYPFTIAKAGTYSLRAIGLGKEFAQRLEDAEGWPLMKPGQRGEIEQDLTPGQYMFYSLPEPVESRRLTVLREVVPPRTISGKGPHDLQLNEPLDNIWREAPGRPADVYRLDVAAPVHVTVELSLDMVAELSGMGLTQPVSLIGGRAWQGELAAGAHEIQVKASVKNDRLPYTVEVRTNELIPGLRQRVRSLPADFVVSVGKDGLVDLFSFGRQDLKAALWSDSTLIAESDDIDGDWNFWVSRKLKAGRYQLRVMDAGQGRATGAGHYQRLTEETGRPVRRPDMVDRDNQGEGEGEGQNTGEENAGREGEEAAGETPPPGNETEESEEGEPSSTSTESQPIVTEVIMYQWTERGLDPHPLPFSLNEALGREVLRLPLSTPAGEGVLHVTAKAKARTALALLKEDKALAEAEGEFYIPLPAGKNYNLLVWFPTAAGGEIKLGAEFLLAQATALTGPALTEPGPEEVVAPSGTAPAAAQPAPDREAVLLPAVPVLKMTNPSTLSWRFQPESGRLYFSPGLERPCLPVDATADSFTAEAGWLICPEGAAKPPVKAKPFVLPAATARVARVGDLPLPFVCFGNSAGPALLEIESAGDSIGALVCDKEQWTLTPFNWQGMWRGTGLTLAGIPDKGRFFGRVWQTGAVAGAVSAASRETASQQIKVRLAEYTWQQAETDFKATGELSGVISPGKGIAINLVDGAQEIEAWLTRGLVAFDWQSGRSTVFSYAPANECRSLNVAGGKLVLVNRGPEAAMYRLIKRGQPAFPSERIQWPAGLEVTFERSGELWLPVPALPPGTWLFVFGAKVEATLFGSNGQAYRTEADGDIAMMESRPGWLYVKHPAGYLRAWAAPRDKFLDVYRPTGAVELGELTGEAVTLEDRLQSWAVKLDTGAFVEASTLAPGITSLESAGQILEVNFEESGQQVRRVMQYLPAGQHRLWTWPLPGVPQKGKLAFQVVVPQALDAGNTTLSRLIGPGQLQAFRFKVAEDNKVGVGLKSASAGLTARLYDAAGKWIDVGPFMINQLKAGEYMLLVESAGALAQYEILLYGQNGARQEIPEEVIRQYLR